MENKILIKQVEAICRHHMVGQLKTLTPRVRIIPSLPLLPKKAYPSKLLLNPAYDATNDII